MEKAYIILAHKNPTQLLQLIRRLDDSRSTFFLHIDKKVNIQDFKQVINYSSRIHLVKRESAHWGSFNLVKATINALKAIQENHGFERITLLSGQDYPIKRNDFFDDYYRSTDKSIFLEYTTIPDFKRWEEDNGGMYRVNKYFFGLQGYQLLASKTINLGSTVMPFLKRKELSNVKPFAGSQWWTIDNYALNYILSYIDKNPRYTAFHKYTFAPDELYFHSILLNSKDQRIIEGIENNNLMYTKWYNSTASHPELLGKDDVPDMIKSDSLFARKFEQENNTEVFDLINKTLDKQGIAKKVEI